jgi:hypothetical protein
MSSNQLNYIIFSKTSKNEKSPDFSELFCGLDGTRTGRRSVREPARPAPCVTGMYSNRLNYIIFSKTPKNEKSPDFSELSAVWTGLEPATPCVTGMYSNQLNYQTV